MRSQGSLKVKEGVKRESQGDVCNIESFSLTGFKDGGKGPLETGKGGETDFFPRPVVLLLIQ